MKGIESHLLFIEVVVLVNISQNKTVHILECPLYDFHIIFEEICW